MAKIAEVIAGYRKLREQKELIKERHAEELAPLNETMQTMGAWLQRELHRSGMTSAKTEQGTAYLSTTASAVVEDWAAVMQYIRDREAAGEDVWALLEHRVSKVAVMELLESTGELPPGVRVTRTEKVLIRKA